MLADRFQETVMRMLKFNSFSMIAAALGASLVLGACGEAPTEATEEDTAPADGAEAPDGTVSDGGGAADGGSSSGSDDTASSSSGGADAVVDGGTASSGGPDGTTSSSGGDAVAPDDDATATDASPVDAGAPTKVLSLPDCAKGACFNCGACADTPMCLNGTTYKNDCFAICKLQAFDWPTGYSPTQGACPNCKNCTGHKVQCNNVKGECEECTAKGGCKSNGDACKNESDCKWTPVCAVLKSGAEVTVDVPCEAECLDLDTKIGQSGIKYAGACKSKCSFPIAKGGGGCPNNIWQPVCSKKDGKTYSSQCAMQNCAKQGCYAIGKTAKTDQCTEAKMEAECAGECYDKNNLAWKGCSGDCKPVCGIAKNKKGVNYRNKCIATASGAKIGDCSGITTTKNDKCSAQLYVEGNVPCCTNVQYELAPNPVCAALGAGATAQWITFHNKTEFDCWDTKAKANKAGQQWEFKFSGSCICKCLKTKKPVCGADGFTYNNACIAKCYNGDSFTWKDGACPS